MFYYRRYMCDLEEKVVFVNIVFIFEMCNWVSTIV